MCNYTIDWDETANALSLSADEVKQALNYDKEALSGFADDGIIEFDDNHIRMLPEAAPFVRNVAASLDKLIQGSDKKFSKAI